MENYTNKKWNIPTLIGISAKNIEEHLKLYEGYVNNTNLIINKIKELSVDKTANMYVLGELHRRFGFEFDGMRNHEYFFSLFEGGPKEINKESNLNKQIEKQWGSFEDFLADFKSLAVTRGIGWAMLYYDKSASQLVTTWVDEHHLGQLNGLTPVLCLDIWEHAFVSDYYPSGKKQYIEDFFKNVNWEVAENNFDK